MVKPKQRRLIRVIPFAVVFVILVSSFFACGYLKDKFVEFIGDNVAEQTQTPEYDVTWNPDGSVLAVAETDFGLCLYTEALQKLLCLDSDDIGGVTSTSWSPDGLKIAGTGGTGTIRIWDVQTGHILNTLQAPTKAWKVAWSPDGSKIASIYMDSVIRIWDAETLHHIAFLKGHTDQVTALAWSPDGQKLASGSRDATVRLWNINTEQLLFTLQDTYHPQAGVHIVAWTSDSETLASVTWGGTLPFWNPNTGQEKNIIVFPLGDLLYFNWTANRDQFVYGTARELGIWDIAQGHSSFSFEPFESTLYSVDYNPTQNRIAASSPDQIIRIWNMRTGELLVERKIEASHNN